MGLKNFMDWFIPENMRDDEQLYMRARSNVAVSMALAVAAIIFGGLYSIMHHPGGMAAIFVLVGGLIIPAPFILRYSGSVKVSGNLIALSMLLIQTYLSFTTGGIHGQNTSWFATVPVLAALLLGFGYCLFWGIVSILVVVLLFVLSTSGFSFGTIPLSPGEELTIRFIIYAGLVAIIAALALLFEGLKNSAFKRSKSAFEKLQDAFREITENAEMLAASSNELTSVSEKIQHNSDDSMEKVNGMVQGTNEVNRNIHNLASSIEQITTGVREISGNTSDAANVSDEAVEMVESVDKMIAKLVENNKEIGQMTTLITDIAFQTNLLALNASIEAARAGEMGRGFAVVAGAVRSLSLDASEAAKQIKDKIHVVQEDTVSAIDSVRQINELIFKFHGLMNGISSAIKEQTDTLSHMSENATRAAEETTMITESSKAVSNSTDSTAKGISDILSAAKEMSHMAESLKNMTGGSTA